MPFKVSWLVEKRVIFSQTSGYLTTDDLITHNSVMEEYARVGENLVHIISDSTDVTGMNVGLRDLQKIRFPALPNLGWAISISPKPMERFFASVMMQLTNKRGRQFATLEEALRFLQEIDETLPPLSIPEESLKSQS